MNKNIIKRSGEEKLYDGEKIINAIKKANATVDKMYQLSDAKIKMIEENIHKDINNSTHAVSVEDIQDKVEKGIMEMRGYEVAQNYIRYRYQRSISRKSNTTDDAILSLLDHNNEEAKQENANKNPLINSTQRDYMAGYVSRDLTERVFLPEDIVKAHKEGIIHFHDSDYFAQHEHNCFHGNTKLVTNLGVRRFKDFNDGAKIQVIDKNGQWRTATVHMYGKKKMQIVTLQSAASTVKICCTSDHRWLLKDGTITTNLQVNDHLLALPELAKTNFDLSDPENARLWALGFAIGDGVDIHKKSGNASYTKIRLCGHKNEYIQIFKTAGYNVHKPIGQNGDYVVVTKGAIKQDFLNGKAWAYLSKEQSAYIFAGLFAADGHTYQNVITTADNRIAALIRSISALAGYYISSERTEIRNTNFKENATLTTFHFRTKQNPNNIWIVKKIKPYHPETEFEAWCVEEPATHSFTLANGIVTGNCDLVNLEDMLQNGTVISGTMIEKPHSFYTACNITTQIIAQVASNQYGGQTFTLSHLAPFVDISRKKYEKTVREEMAEAGVPVSNEKIEKIVESRVHDEIVRGVQTIQYQLITLMTCNGQAPFVTMFMYLDEVPEGRLRDDLALIIEEVLKQRIQGVKNEKGAWITPAFPKIIYTLDEDNIYPESKYYYLTELAARCTAKRMVPDYISAKIMREYKGDTYPCMGCRSFLTPDNEEQPEGLCNAGNKANAGNYVEGQHKYYGRFNQGVVTINLVDVACSSHGNMEDFWRIFDERLELCHRALQMRHKKLLGTTSDVAPILWQYGALARLQKGEKIDKLLFGNYSTISLGYAGLYEMCVRMTGKSHTDKDAKNFALQVMQHMNDKCAEWRKAENISYSLYGTPMESTTYKFAKCLQKRFGIIKDVTDHNYITNSYHVNVRENIDAFTKLKFESQFQKLSPGGAISYVEVPNMQDNIEAVLSIMKCIYDNIMYAELNTKSDYCQVCGFDGELRIVKDDTGKLIWECPNCRNRNESKMNIARRVCGYIGGSNGFNAGRLAEINDRKIHVAVNSKLSIKENTNRSSAL